MTNQTNLRANALQLAVEAVGGQTALAERLTTLLGRRIRQSHVRNWLVRDQQGAPAEVCRAIQRATGISVHQLRPDVFGADESDVAPSESSNGSHTADLPQPEEASHAP